MANNERFIDQAVLPETAENLSQNHSWIRDLIKYGVELQSETNSIYKNAHIYQMITGFFHRSRNEVVCVEEMFPVYKLGLIQPALDSVLKEAKHIDHDEYEPKVDPSEQGYFPLEIDYNTTKLALKLATDTWITPAGSKLITRFRFNHAGAFGQTALMSLRIYALPEHLSVAEQVMKQIKLWIIENNFLRGKRITLHGSFLSLDRHYTWNDIVLESNIQQELIENVVDFIKYIPIYQANRIPLKRGLILHGLPGVGKTLVGKVLSSAVDCTFIWVTTAHIEGPQSVTDLFAFARELHPCIIFFEDLDFFGKERNSNAYSPVLGELMVQMDGIVENEGVIVIATTNALEKIEPALKDRPSRFDRVLEFKLPNPEMRKKIIAHALKGKTANGINIDHIAEKTEGYTGAHLQELVILAVKVAIEQKAYDEANIVKLTDAHFETALTQMQKKKEKLLGFCSKS